MKTFFTLLLCIITLFASSAQKTTISGKLPSKKGAVVKIMRPTNQFITSPKGFVTATTISPTGSFNLNADFLNKEIVVLSIEDTTGSNRILFKQYLYISKGNNLLISENASKAITITGVGAQYNQLDGISTFYHYGQTKQDSLPSRLYKVVTGFYEKDKKSIDSLIASQNPSADFINAWGYHLKYARLASMYYTYDDLNTMGQQAYKRNKHNWQSFFNTLANEAPVSDEKALAAPSYHQYLDLFLETKYVDSRTDYFNTPKDFYKEWFDGDSLNGKRTMQIDFRNQLKQKIIERYFDGKVKEQMYAFLFASMIRDRDFTNIETIYERFSKQYPDSKFNPYFKQTLREAISRSEHTAGKRTIFLDDAKNWDAITTYFKGKTVLLDMWGSWCRPCREDINLYSADLKRRFKHKDLTFLYITNYDSEVKWKQLIAYYKLEGYHIFASEDLTKEIMRKIKRNGYPSYAIIDKYGNVEKMRAESLKEKEILDAQIEEALKK